MTTKKAAHNSKRRYKWFVVTAGEKSEQRVLWSEGDLVNISTVSTILVNRERMLVPAWDIWLYHSMKTVIPLHPCKLTAEQTKLLSAPGLIHTRTLEDCHATQADSQESREVSMTDYFWTKTLPKPMKLWRKQLLFPRIWHKVGLYLAIQCSTT